MSVVVVAKAHTLSTSIGSIEPAAIFWKSTGLCISYFSPLAIIFEALLLASTKLSAVSLSTAPTKATVPSVVFTTTSLFCTVVLKFCPESVNLFDVVAVAEPESIILLPPESVTRTFPAVPIYTLQL